MSGFVRGRKWLRTGTVKTPKGPRGTYASSDRRWLIEPIISPDHGHVSWNLTDRNARRRGRGGWLAFDTLAEAKEAAVYLDDEDTS